MHIVNVGYDSTNFYALGQGHQRLLIDVGWPGTFPKLLASLKRKDIPLQDIRYLLVTHYHPDHAGLAQEMKAKGVRLIVLRQQLSALPLLKTHMKPINHYVDITLNDNLQLTTAESRAFLQRLGIEGEIVSTPGHSDDSVTLVLDEGIAFTGDLTNPAAAEDTSDTPLTQSWNRLRALGVTHIYPGHGPVWPL
jgi:ribonuclease/clavin/mitogillin